MSVGISRDKRRRRHNQGTVDSLLKFVGSDSTKIGAALGAGTYTLYTMHNQQKRKQMEADRRADGS